MQEVVLEMTGADADHGLWALAQGSSFSLHHAVCTPPPCYYVSTLTVNYASTLTVKYASSIVSPLR